MTVTLDVWRVPPRRAAKALWQVATLPPTLRRTDGITFTKVLGTARGFGRSDPTRWAALTVWTDKAQPIRRFDRIAAAHCRLTLRPLVSHGRWARREPFGTPTVASKHDKTDGDETPGPLLVLTRARLRPSQAPAFWRQIGPVASTLDTIPGLIAAFGVGEAPIAFQGTVSIWANAAAIAGFAYRTAEHVSVVAQTRIRRWYAEELFARLAILDVAGDREVIGWSAERA
jgi:hypothetical protein